MSAPKRNKRPISGWIVLDKPYDMTSTQAVGKCRWLYGAAKAGHAGTLDPLATGILPIALGEATKTVPAIQDGEKTYRFAIAWGAQTATDDAEGEVVATSDHRPTEAELLAALPRFTGAITQVPPAFSAIRIDGERAYDLARAGEAVEMAPRQVVISALRLIGHGQVKSELEMVCEKGTYVRALARDLAEHLGTRGHVAALRRTAVGPFSEVDAITIDALEAMALEARDAALLPVSAGLADLPEIRLSPDQATAVRHGNPVLLVGAGAPVALDDAWASLRGEAIAIGHVERGQFKPRRVLN
ncbi:tRNA pseudouridine(55) synthase TruB [Arsenicitalea aurantiaca]|uniref:tRNA pseudouridine synthase B n=1 Tax=Arsenicitalea aurantiaca TaxID=1783274 RepID=A0A433X819_9HYPH|nr:tRNA pseudouridine(55) synthase TruB [Arsenicitalea aurantiaca]RUT30216.1 tRNA pseudouridine(55) synthase TruB [Arsenicitalea aurantiaca]